MATSDEILAVAAREIGYHESPGKRNKFGAWYGMDGVAWCMQFVQWVYHQAGATLPYKTASCGALLSWYRINQPECITKEPIPGCIVIFDFPNTAYNTDHTGLFVKLDGQKIVTIDGNTSNGNDTNGGYVQERARPLSYANPTYIIPRGLFEMDIDKLISEMTDAQADKLMSKAERHRNANSIPEWARSEFADAISHEITDGTNPMSYTPRYQTAIMIERALKIKK